MKRFILIVISCVFVVTLTSAYGFAQTDKCMKMDEEMMKQMMADKKDMMQMMMDMMNMQEKMIKGPKTAEKKQMMKNIAQMKEKMRKMMLMPMPMDMPGMDDSQSKLKCAEPWLKKAIDLHEVHLKDPETATEASQMEMMNQMKKAYDCITGSGPDISGTQLKEVEGKEPKTAEPSMTDSHKH